MVARLDLTGQRFGRLTAIRYAESRRGKAHWLCKCDCGGESVSSATRLKAGGVLSCGCLVADATIKACRTHGLTRTSEHTTWLGIRKRCNNPNDPSFPRYGGRGIRVCEEWDSSFERFLSDMGMKPSPLHTIDRIDNDGPYAAWNCRWVEQKTQQRNKRSNVIIEFEGESRCISEWAEMFGIKQATLRARLRNNWPIREALTTPTASSSGERQ